MCSHMLRESKSSLEATDQHNDSDLINNIFSKTKREKNDLEYVLKLIKKYSVINECYKKAQHYIELASSSLSIFRDSEQKEILNNLTSFSLARNF